jgi:transposase
MDIRQQKGVAIATSKNLKKDGNLWLVPSQSGNGKYKVNAEDSHCTCPDYDLRRAKCKHIYAVEYTIEKTKTTVTENGKTTVTETVKVTRKTYPQVWPAYNKAQVWEKSVFLHLLNKLCEGVGEPAQTNGRPRIPLEDMIFAMAFKVYSTMSGRRFMTDLRDAHGKGYISKVPCYNSLFNYFEMDMLTPYLQMLIEESSLPLKAVESDFAVDSSGLSTGAHQRWVDVKWGAIRAQYTDDNRKDWVKLHLMCGVKTNVVTAVEVTDSHTADCPMFKPLVEATAENFVMDRVCADKAYISDDNLRVVAQKAAMPFIPFKSTNIGHGKGQSSLWKKMYHYFSYNQERFMHHYHKRSNVETTFAMIKAKFGGKLRSKTQRAQINEALCKVLCHNICCLIQSMYELKIRPKFYAEVA